MVPIPFSTDDDGWPLVAVLTWIATRSLRFTESYASRSIDDANALLELARAHGGVPPGVSFADAFHALCQKIEAKDIAGQAAKLKWVVPPDHEQDTPDKYFSLAPPELFEACDFLPQELRNRMIAGEPALQLNDFVFHDGDCLTPKGSGYGAPNSDGSRVRWSWRGVTFSRDDVLRVWRELDCVVAWRRAREQFWAPPKGFSPEWVNFLSPGQYVSIAEVVSLLAYGPDRLPIGLSAIDANAIRLRAGIALLGEAADAKITLCGHSTFRLPHFPGGIAPIGALKKLEPNWLIGMTLVIDGAHDWLGDAAFAEAYPERGQVQESVSFVGVVVHRDSLRRWFVELADIPAPNKRGPKFQFPWDAIEQEALRLMDKFGEFSRSKPNWSAQARLESKLLEFCSQKFDREPSLTQIRTHIGKWLTLWRNAGN